jgi:DNA-directed RNA polymerase subunit RPC12/RpoP
MGGQGRTVAWILMVLGVVVVAASALYLFSGMAEGRLRLSGFLLGIGLALLVALPLLAGGVFLLARSRSEALQFADVEREKRILNIVRTQGQVNVSDIAIEMNLTREQVREHIYDLVGKELFTGYINWDEGVLYAVDAAVMRTTKCPNCGGVREVVGKGTVKCPYCGSELFL